MDPKYICFNNNNNNNLLTKIQLIGIVWIFENCNFDIWSALFVNSRDYLKGPDTLWKVDILLWMIKIFMMTGWDFIMNDRDFPQIEIFMMATRDYHDSRSRFFYDQWWQVDIVMMTGRDFHDGRLIFLLWPVEIFKMAGRYFHDDRSRFSWWQVEIFIMTSGDFHDGRSRFL